MDDLRERIHPVFNAARSTLVYLMQAGDPDAALVAGELGVEADSVFRGEQQRGALSAGMTAVVDAYYETMNQFLAAAPEQTIVDLGCGYTPRALWSGLAGKRFVGCDLSVVTDEMGPVVEKLLADDLAREPADYRGADFTSYASLRSVLDDVRGPLCLTTEGTLAYLTQPEIVQVCANVRRILREFGGRWLTPDPEAGIRTVSTLKAVMGEDALNNVMSAASTFSGQSYVALGGNSLVVRFWEPDSYEKSLAFLRENGLRARLLPMGERLPELRVFAQLTDEQRQAVREAYADLKVWEIAPDPAWSDPAAGGSGCAFGLHSEVRGKTLTVSLRGRVDSLTAPEFLAAVEKAAADCAITNARVDMSELEYISSAGLRVLLIMIKRLGLGNVAVTGANKLVQSIFEQTGYAGILAVR